MKAATAPPVTLKRRCAVYTRKSSEEGLDMAFNSLDAQREACQAYVYSQKAEGWLLLSDHYDDGGYSGGTIERPGLKRLLADIEAGAVDVVVVYKIDRLSRSLLDFTKLVEVFERHNVTFVSVTQHFSTSTSMGRLTLNMLLSFAQFEREIAGERIRDKIAASRRKGIYMGGNPPLGYDVKERRLEVNPVEAKLVRRIFERFVTLGSATLLCRELNAEGYTGKAWTARTGRVYRGQPFCKTSIYKILHNRTYLGEAVHKGNSYPGQHKAILDIEAWDAVHALLKTNGRVRANCTRAQTPALLRGLIFSPTGKAMTPSHTRKKGRLYRYYVTTDVIKHGPDACPVKRIPATEAEAAIIDQVRALLRTPEIVVRTWQHAKAQDPNITERQVRESLHRLDPLWHELFPAEQARIVQLLVERVDVGVDCLTLTLRVDGLASVANDLRGRNTPQRRAA